MGLATTRTRRQSASRWRADLERIAIYAFLGFMVLFNLLPFAWPLVSAFGVKPANVSGIYLFWPVRWTLEHFRAALVGRGQALLLLRNSLVMTGSAVLLAVACCCLAGYSLSRGRFRFRRSLLYGILLIQVIPTTATVLPYYLIMRDLKLVNTLFGVTLGLATSQIPFITWVMKGFFDAVPIELEEAAWLDGADHLQALVRVIFPLAVPGVGAAIALAFNNVWGAFFLPLIMLSSPDRYVLSLGLFNAVVIYTYVDYGMMNAIALIYMTPCLLVFLSARQYLIRGTMAGAMAGQ